MVLFNQSRAKMSMKKLQGEYCIYSCWDQSDIDVAPFIKKSAIVDPILYQGSLILCNIIFEHGIIYGIPRK